MAQNSEMGKRHQTAACGVCGEMGKVGVMGRGEGGRGGGEQRVVMEDQHLIVHIYL